MEYPTSQIIPLPDLWLFHNKEDAREFLASRNENPALVDNCPGQCICIEGETDTEPYCVVVLNYDFAKHAETCGLIAHEAYHVTCFVFEHIGEEDAGEETTAYVLQAITTSLVHAHGEYMRDLMESEGADANGDTDI